MVEGIMFFMHFICFMVGVALMLFIAAIPMIVIIVMTLEIYTRLRFKESLFFGRKDS